MRITIQSLRRFAFGFAIIMGNGLFGVTQSSESLIRIVWREHLQRKVPVLSIEADEGILSKRQGLVLRSGFSFVSDFVITSDEQKIERTYCLMKYDRWEENFLNLLAPKSPRLMTDAYARTCLVALIVDESALAPLRKNGGRLGVSLHVEQVHPEQAKKLRDWIVKQQSFLIQDLFAHMLGDLTPEEKTEFSVKIPPAPGG